MAVIVSAPRDEALFRYLLCGTRLLHSMVDLAPRHAKLEQVAFSALVIASVLLSHFVSLFSEDKLNQMA